MIFKRYELKYLLNEEQKRKVLDAMRSHMRLDEFGRHTIRNIYFDTENYRLIRKSIDAKDYKEKLRLRSYKEAGGEDFVYFEIKKKYESVVYKRRIKIQQKLALSSVINHEKITAATPKDEQVAKEIDYFVEFYNDLMPKVYLSYEREAYAPVEDSDFRVTFDENIMYRLDRLDLGESPEGEKILPEGFTLMEIKTPGGIPMWMTKCLTENKIYKTSFSKYGNAYKKENGYV